MESYRKMTREQLEKEMQQVKAEYRKVLDRHLSLNMARGKPCREQLQLSMGMMSLLQTEEEMYTQDGTDCRNYGVLDGIPEAKKFMADLTEASPENVIVAGNSSLNLMYTLLSDACLFGILGSRPWSELAQKKFLCPTPGYDRHFRITQRLGFTLIPIPMHPDGPDMDMVRDYVEKDPSVKGIWCVPKYSNPDGYTYSDQTVEAFAALRPAAEDFRIMWDNAYIVHHFDVDHPDQLSNILEECRKAGHPDMVYEFVSTSKITFPGAGISAVITSPANVKEIKTRLGAETIGFDKINQLRQVRFFRDMDGLKAHMRKHADQVKPRFDIVWRYLKPLGDLEIATWTTPHGGYFLSLYTLDGCAARTVELCKNAGVVLTGAGAAYPYGKDPDDHHIRIAPTYPSKEDLTEACEVLSVCVRLAALEKLLEQ